MPTVLALIPHPDDESYAFGGLLALLADAGWRCLVHAATAGEGGERHDGGPVASGTLAIARERELADSCRILGAEPPVVWNLPDGGLDQHSAEGLARVSAVLGEVEPDLLLALGPDGAYGHPDHLAVHRWAVEAWSNASAATRPALLFAAFPRGLFLPQYEKCIGMMGDPPHPPPDEIGQNRFDLEFDIRAVTSRKLQAIAAHRSQLPHGDPHALFPPGIVPALLEHERYIAADGASLERARVALDLVR